MIPLLCWLWGGVGPWVLWAWGTVAIALDAVLKLCGVTFVIERLGKWWRERETETVKENR